VKEAAPHLPVQLLKSGPLGGDQQIGALIAENGIDALFFLVDPLSPMPHDVDVKALMRLALVYNVPMALNLATAEALLTDLVATVPDR
jgi:methylglyoxal synthase